MDWLRTTVGEADDEAVVDITIEIDRVSGPGQRRGTQANKQAFARPSFEWKGAIAGVDKQSILRADRRAGDGWRLLTRQSDQMEPAAKRI